MSVNSLLVLNMLKDSPRSTVNQLASELRLSDSVVKSILDTSIECGLIEAYGTGRGRTYMLSANVYKTKKEKIGYVRHKDIEESRYLELIINMAKSNDYIARADVVSLLHVDEDKAYKLLKQLVIKGKLIPVNKGRYSKYRYFNK